MSEFDRSEELMGWTADVVSAYVQKNVVPAAKLPELINSVYGSLKDLGEQPEVTAPFRLGPAVPVKKSITPEAVTCLECGRRFKSLRRHLATHHELAPDNYREKWKLPGDYPMVAPLYSEARSKLAKDTGLGQRRAKTTGAVK